MLDGRVDRRVSTLVEKTTRRHGHRRRVWRRVLHSPRSSFNIRWAKRPDGWRVGHENATGVELSRILTRTVGVMETRIIPLQPAASASDTHCANALESLAIRGRLIGHCRGGDPLNKTFSRSISAALTQRTFM